MNSIIKKVILLIVQIGSPLTLIASSWLKIVRKSGTGIINDRIFMWLGILPVLDHYYEPLINPKKHLKKSLRDDRYLPCIDFNIDEQLKLISDFNYNNELLKIPLNEDKSNFGFYYNNGSYESGDAEFLYNLIRHFKPNRIIEIGSGYSTLMARNAIKQNQNENQEYSCEHICVEPYEMPWLENLNIKLVRELVENLEINFFQKLRKNDILFIDSSHVIRPQGDVNFEILNLLPSLNSGVVIHIHDIFTPKDYPDDWVIKEHRLWNEQYLLEAFLTSNKDFRIIGALNYLSHNYKKEFEDKCPVFAKQQGREPGAFWMIKN